MTDWADRLGLERPRAKSLIVTVYGDALLPRGGQCWLSDLIHLVQPLGVNERMTRTAVFRLVQDGLLDAERVGRRSRYALTPAGRTTFDSAQARIYTKHAPESDGRWTLILLPKDPDARAQVTKALGWIGYAPMREGLLGGPRHPDQALRTLEEIGFADRCTLFDATPTRPDQLPDLVSDSWDLESLAVEYEAFLTAFGGFSVEQIDTDEDAFQIRTLLVHAYRRALLRDPALPEAQLPEEWPGTRARALIAAHYSALTPRVDRFLAQTMSDDSPAPSKVHRFL